MSGLTCNDRYRPMIRVARHCAVVRAHLVEAFVAVFPRTLVDR